MSRKDEIGLEGQSDLLHAKRQIGWRATRSRDAIRNKGAIRGVRPEQEEFLLAQLVGISANQIRTWPEIVRLLEDAQGRDWSRPMVLVPPDGEAKGITVRTFGSFETVYAELVEPWLGSWVELQKTYARFKAGEISEQQGTEEIQRRKLRDKSGRPPKAEQDNGAAAPLRKGGNSNAYWRDRLERDRPNVLARLEAGEFKSARQAAIACDLKKSPDPFDELCR
jgi:hypothetical protein